MFLYFDLGKVLLDFSVERMCQQIGDVAGVAAARVKEVVFGSHLQERYERGEITTGEFYEAFCQWTGTKADCAALTLAASDIFSLNTSMLPVIGQLAAAGRRLGILSNTCAGHWEHCLGRYPLLRETFSVYALSYELKAAKPDPEIYRKAATLARLSPEEIFYTDDILLNVEGARAAGFDAVHYTSTPQLIRELHHRGLWF
jgi:HAD superfamily hydrolase (TIGR01509 family)